MIEQTVAVDCDRCGTTEVHALVRVRHTCPDCGPRPLCLDCHRGHEAERKASR